MKPYSFTDKAGVPFTVTAPSEDIAMRMARDIVEERAQEAQALPTAPTLETLGGFLPEDVPPRMLPPSGNPLGRAPTSGERFAIGGAENLEEIGARLGLPQDRLWESPTGERWAQFAPGTWSPLNPLGMETGDFVQALNDPAAWGAAAMQLSPQVRALGILGQGAMSALGGGGGYLAGEGLEALQGLQRQNPLQVAQDAAKAATQEGLLGAAGAGLARMTPTGGLTVQGQRAAEDLRRAVRLPQMYEEFPAGLASDILRETGVGPLPGRIVGAAEKQADAMIGDIAAKRSDNAMQAMRGVQEHYRLDPAKLDLADQALVDASMSQQDDILRARAGEFPGAEEGARVGRAGLGVALKDVAGGMVTEAYEEAGEAAFRKPPIFDISRFQPPARQGPVLTQTSSVESGVFDETGAPIMALVQDAIDALPPDRRLGFVRDVLQNADPRQLNWEALQALRTQVGLFSEDEFYRTQAGNPARKLYGDLTEVLHNPVNSSPEFVEKFKKATELADWRFGLRDDDAVKRLLKDKGAATVIREFAMSPEDYLTPKFRELMNLAPEADREMFRRSMHQAILDSPDPTATIDRMKKSGTLDSYDYLFGSPAERADLERRAVRISQWNNSPQGRIYRERGKKQNALRVLLNDVTDPMDAQAIVSSVSKADRPLLQNAIVDRAVRRSTKIGGARDEPMVDTKILEQEISRLKETGLWGVLTDAQQDKVQDLASYYRVFFRNMTDFGSALENASLVANLKGFLTPWHPKETMRGIESLHGILQNRIVASAITSPARYERLVKRLKKRPKQLGYGALLGILGAPPGLTALMETSRESQKEIQRNTQTPPLLTVPPPAGL